MSLACVSETLSFENDAAVHSRRGISAHRPPASAPTLTSVTTVAYSLPCAGGGRQGPGGGAPWRFVEPDCGHVKHAAKRWGRPDLFRPGRSSFRLPGRG